jgi:hypothetical protein
LCNLDHTIGGVACSYRDAVSRKKERVFAGTAVEFQDMVAAAERLRENTPYSVALGSTDKRSREMIVIVLRHDVEGEDSLGLGGGRGIQASTSA